VPGREYLSILHLDILKSEPIRSDEEMAGTVLYLVSRAGSYTNGQEIFVDGGYTMVNPTA
jgi:NAD(P)-dependent dehydrogenase (short-subunit alcohol dehydrogenase family)